MHVIDRAQNSRLGDTVPSIQDASPELFFVLGLISWTLSLMIDQMLYIGFISDELGG